MNKYVSIEPPVYRIDGVDASKAGEWPGKMSNKFHKTRKIIHAVENGIFFMNKENIERPKKRRVTQENSKEWVFKPCIKMVKPIKEQRAKHAFSDILFPAKIEGFPIIERNYDFEKVEDYHNKITAEHKKIMNENLIMSNKNDSKSNILKRGFTKEFYDNVSNNKILGITFTKELYNLYKKNNSPKQKISNEFIKMDRDVMKYKENLRVQNIKNKRELFKRDVNYVSNLAEIDSTS